MKLLRYFVLVIIVVVGCKSTTKTDEPVVAKSNVEVANAFADAFYSFDADSLRSLLAAAIKSQPGILYYQKWAECGHYEEQTRHTPVEKNDSLVILPVTVKDDLMAALGIGFNVTDSFHLTIVNEQIHLVETSSNDPDLYYQAKEWVATSRPDLISVPCEGIWEDGPTPCDCVKGMVAGFQEFKKIELSQKEK